MRELDINDVVVNEAFNHITEQSMYDLAVGDVIRVHGFESKRSLLSVCGLTLSQLKKQDTLNDYQYTINEQCLDLTIKRIK